MVNSASLVRRRLVFGTVSAANLPTFKFSLSSFIPISKVSCDYVLHRVRASFSSTMSRDISPSRSPPVAKKVKHEMEKFGDLRVDNYYWLRDDSRTDPEVLSYLQEENAYTEYFMSGPCINPFFSSYYYNRNVIPAGDFLGFISLLKERLQALNLGFWIRLKYM